MKSRPLKKTKISFNNKSRNNSIHLTEKDHNNLNEKYQDNRNNSINLNEKYQNG